MFGSVLDPVAAGVRKGVSAKTAGESGRPADLLCTAGMSGRVCKYVVGVDA